MVINVNSPRPRAEYPLIHTLQELNLVQDIVVMKKRSRSSDKKTPAEEVLEAVLNPS